MAKCPICDHDVHTPFFLNLDAWAELRCNNCHTRLEMKPQRSGVLATLWAPMFLVARHSRCLEVIAFVFMFATIFLLILESIHPKVQVRKTSPLKPEIRLNINRS
jgi:hypothetical protein